MDLDRIESLLNVAEMARNYPNLKPILDEALKELAKAVYELEQATKEDMEEKPAEERKYG